MPRGGLHGRLTALGAPTSLLIAVSFVLSRYGDQRDLDFVELFSGEGHLASAMEAEGMSVARFEIKYNPDDNMLTTAGWLRALRLICRLRHGALLWAGIPCSSFVFLNRGTSHRTAQHPCGDEAVPSVKSANVIVSRVILLLLVAIARNAAWAVEQPLSSLMDLHPRFAQLKELCRGLAKLHAVCFSRSV